MVPTQIHTFSVVKNVVINIIEVYICAICNLILLKLYDIPAAAGYFPETMVFN
jgi:hypothetical protein